MRIPGGWAIALLLAATLALAAGLIFAADASASTVPHSKSTRDQCLVCHESLPAAQSCLTCHSPTSVKPMPEGHQAYPESACLSCHSSSDGLLLRQALAVPHGLAGQEQCFLCHAPQAMQPVPASHSIFDESDCLVCHSLSPAQPPEDTCLYCHGREDLGMTLEDGSRLPLFIDGPLLQGSVHGDILLCTDCHAAISGYPHAEWDIPGERAYSIAQYDLCKRCHFDNYTKTLDSLHYQMLSRGEMGAPLCTDCHGDHYIAAPSQPRADISLTCSTCHESLYQQYAGSVHGEALIAENNFDVPVCTDCHRSHDIADPRTASFRFDSVELCGGCHTDPDVMSRYGLSTNVLKTYLEDFHGQTVALVARQSRDIWTSAPVCTDCHGIHDIQGADSPDSPVMKANLAATCQSCHPDASDNFPSAWLSHYEPTINRAPVVFFARWFYRIMIPFILVGLTMHVLLDVWREITNR